MALVITVEPGRGIKVDDKTTIGVQRVEGRYVRLVIFAPDEVKIQRVEIPPDPRRRTN